MGGVGGLHIDIMWHMFHLRVACILTFHFDCSSIWPSAYDNKSFFVCVCTFLWCGLVFVWLGTCLCKCDQIVSFEIGMACVFSVQVLAIYTC